MEHIGCKNICSDVFTVKYVFMLAILVMITQIVLMVMLSFCALYIMLSAHLTYTVECYNVMAQAIGFALTYQYKVIYLKDCYSLFTIQLLQKW